MTAKRRGVCADKAPMVTKKLKQAIMVEVERIMEIFEEVTKRYPPPKFNMEPNKVWFVDVSPFPRKIFTFHVSFRGCTLDNLMNRMPKSGLSHVVSSTAIE